MCSFFQVLVAKGKILVLSLENILERQEQLNLLFHVYAADFAATQDTEWGRVSGSGLIDAADAEKIKTSTCQFWCLAWGVLRDARFSKFRI